MVEVTMARPTRVSALIVLLLLGGLGAGCSSGTAEDASPAEAGPAEAASLTAEFEVADFTITGPSQLPAGATRVTVENTGSEPHHLVFARLADGQSAEDFFASFTTLDPTGVAELLGGPNGVKPGASLSATVALEPGRYVLACFIPSPDGVPHFLKGMTAELTVVRSAVPDDLPDAARTVHLDEYEFGRGGQELAGFDGTGTMTVSNEGTELHELTIVRLRDGATLEDVTAAASTPVGSPRPDPLPYESAGGVSFLSPGRSSWVDVDAFGLAPGRYAFVCFIPSPSDRISHAAKGMVHEFTL
jgi:uncharacterized cupredoxin-like copper-binding protein